MNVLDGGGAARAWIATAELPFVIAGLRHIDLQIHHP
jgi:hypothetical protein